MEAHYNASTPRLFLHLSFQNEPNIIIWYCEVSQFHTRSHGNYFNRRYNYIVIGRGCNTLMSPPSTSPHTATIHVYHVLSTNPFAGRPRKISQVNQNIYFGRKATELLQSSIYLRTTTVNSFPYQKSID